MFFVSPARFFLDGGLVSRALFLGGFAWDKHLQISTEHPIRQS